ncbi:MDR family MFS transporter [Brevibacterium sp. SMBL_HHYL_HB1]|uniref:MDR family MFS transporter n=1 Tax=Brevibacterium sp. SMBL_HHYL_HB1 TaxID=2777556 RepID=UPI00201286AB|nr:MDR family MFS transporter [Brevibacterium sp. SMBL_HHYL_HB1]
MKDGAMSTTPRTGPAENRTEALPRSAKLTIAALIIGAIAAILDATMVTLAIRTLTLDLDSTAATIQWVTTAYLLALGAAVPLTGWLERRLGGKRAWMSALIVFGIASVLCALAWNDTSLIAFRALQGFGGGLIMPLMQTLAVRAVGERVGPSIMATIALPAALGPILGPVVGGVILNWLSWRWLFLVNVPIIAVGLIMAWRFLAADADQRGPARLDWVGLSLLAPGLVGILYGFSQIAEHGDLARPGVLVPSISGVVLLAGFVLWALRAADPLLDVHLLRARSLASASATMFTAGAALYAGMFLLPLYFQQLQGRTVLAAGLLMIAQGLGALVVRFAAGGLVARFGGRTVTIAAFLVAAVGTVPFAVAGPGTSLVWLSTVLFVRGLGIGAVLIPPMSLAYRDVGPESIAHASIHTRILQQVGASFGTAIVAVVLQFVMVHSDASGSTVSAYHASFWAAVGISIAALIPAFALPGRDRERD